MARTLYTVGGSVQAGGGLYIRRRADDELLQLCLEGTFAYVLTPRQMGKSSVMNETAKTLIDTHGIHPVIVDLNQIGAQNITQEEWYLGILTTIEEQLTLETDANAWWKEHAHLGVTQRLTRFFERVVAVEAGGPVVLFVDEIDSTLDLTFTDDFFAAIRYVYHARAQIEALKRVSFVLLGVAQPGDLIRDRDRTPFNIGQAVRLSGFTFEEAQPTLRPALSRKSADPDALLREILHWTGGQPFLTLKICKLVDEASVAVPAGEESAWIRQLVETRVIASWESQDSPEHLKTIRNRVIHANVERTGRLLGLYGQILAGQSLRTDEAPDQMELRLSGLVVERDSVLAVCNPIYRAVFDEAWVERALAALRPYAETLDKWLASGRKEESYLLRGAALTSARKWAEGQRLSDEDHQYLAASQEVDYRTTLGQVEQARLKARVRTTALFRRLSVVLAVVSLLALLAGRVALQQRNEAEKNLKLAEVNEEKANVSAVIAKNKQLEAEKMNKIAQKQSSIASREGRLAAVRAKMERVSAARAKAEQQRAKKAETDARSSSFLAAYFLHPDRQESLQFALAAATITPRPSPTAMRALRQALLAGVQYYYDEKVEVTSLAFSPDHNKLVILTKREIGPSSVESTAEMRDVHTGKLLHQFPLWPNTMVETTAFSADGRKIIFAGLSMADMRTMSDFAELWDADNSYRYPIRLGTVKPSQDWHSITSINFLSQGNQILARGFSAFEEVFFLWNVKTGEQLPYKSPPELIIDKPAKSDHSLDLADSILTSGQVLSLIITNHGGSRNTVEIKDRTANNKNIKMMLWDGGHYNTATFSADGQRILAGTANGKLELWDITGDLLATFKGEAVTNISISADGEVFATGTEGGMVRLYYTEAYYASVDKLIALARKSIFGTPLTPEQLDRKFKQWLFESQPARPSNPPGTPGSNSSKSSLVPLSEATTKLSASKERAALLRAFSDHWKSMSTAWHRCPEEARGTGVYRGGIALHLFERWESAGS